MFAATDLIKVLPPDMFSCGFDFRAAAPCKVGDLVQVSVARKIYTGLIIGPGDGSIAPEKIKPVITHHPHALPETTVEWIKKMSDWTMMPLGAVFKLIAAASDFTKPKNRPRLDTYFDTGKVILNAEQAAAASAIRLGSFSVHLLDGITGSGKTQVYFDAVMRAYESGKQVLLMMPEIALTAQFGTRFADRFGTKPIIWHSNLTPARRRKIWHGVLTDDMKIIVGTRSALFLPWQNLGLAVVDEEHDGSYKQEDMGNYHARDMAVLLAKVADFPVVLASATPSLETVYNARIGKYSASRLTSRYGGAMLPKIEIVDMRKRQDFSPPRETGRRSPAAND